VERDPVARADAGAEAPVPPDPPRPWSLGLRIVSGAAFVPVLIALARVGGAVFLAFVALEVVLGVIEFYRMMRAKGLHPDRAVGLGASLLVLVAAYRPDVVPLDVVVTLGLLLLLAIALSRLHPRPFENLAGTAFGVLYVGWLSAHLVLLRELPWQAGTPYSTGAAFVLLAFFVTWSCDTGAYAIGRMIGRTPLWTRISPRKTVEGAIGGFVAAVAAALIARLWFAPFLELGPALSLGVLVGIFAQVGDLVESLIKRDAQHGDSSDLIPGHGGVLDRFDSLYFGAPIVFYFLKLVVYRVP
jgi:phosphatidate cytidylyltransferase